MIVLAGATLPLAIPFAATAAAAQVSLQEGNIYLRSSSGEANRVTDEGKDRDPALSPDRTLIVFVRDTPGRTVEHPIGEPVSASELWTIRSDGSRPRLILKGGSSNNSNGIPIADFRTPQFSPDGHEIYFLSIASVVSGAIYSIHLDGAGLREVSGGNWFEVVRNGQYSGDLLIEQHRYFAGGGSYDWVYLVDSKGGELAPLGPRSDPSFEIRREEVLGR